MDRFVKLLYGGFGKLLCPYYDCIIFSDFSIIVAALCLNPLSFKRCVLFTEMQGRFDLKSSVLIRQMLPPLIKPNPRIHGIYSLGKISTPFSCIVLIVPVGGFLRRAVIASVLLFYLISLLIIFINLAGFIAPSPIRVDGAHREHDMTVQIPLSGLFIHAVVYGKFSAHPFRYEVPFHIVSHHIFCELIAP